MTAEQFCYWLQGYYELSDEGRGLSQKDVPIWRFIINDTLYYISHMFNKK